MIRYAEKTDINWLAEHDRHIPQEELERAVELRRVLLLEEGGGPVGWLRYNFFWDNTPFMNMLYFLEGWRGKGLGGRLTGFWEAEMKDRGFTRVMTSSQADERGQFFYRKHGYVDCGSLLLPGEPLEIIFLKDL